MIVARDRRCMQHDPKDKPRLTHEDVLALDFIRESGPVVFRRYYHTGLRSHIMEVLDRQEVELETAGIIIDGRKWFPRARPLKMLRIFRRRFECLKEAEEELKRVKIIEGFLLPDYMARSHEFLADFTWKGKREIMLCGLQEYVEGETIDPWGTLEEGHLLLLYRLMSDRTDPDDDLTETWLRNVRERASELIERIKRMITNAGHIPDLAGIGNLILTRSGQIRLVDINNISEVSFEPVIPLDDRGYPVCDKSIEALYLLESKLLGGSTAGGEELYRVFLDPKRMKDVGSIEERFLESMKTLQ